jgi:uncharacterized protein
MDERTYLTILYDYYGELLNEKQKKCFEEYYFNNLSLGEISINFKVSRNAIHKQIKKVEEILKEYENKLKLYDKSTRLDKLISKIKDERIRKELEEINR